ncbi:MAG: FtsX-like permease family protein [Acidimicrobiales bacterium]|nr:FtsX-like permease family protein [Acidimicrobiales bacterium]
MTLIKLALRGIMAKKARFALTTASILFGVAFLVGVFVTTDGLRSYFGDLAENIAGRVDYQVRGEIEFGDRLDAAPVPVDVLDDVAAVDGVAIAQPGIIANQVVAVDGDGEALTANGPPQFAVGWPDVPELASVFLVQDGVSRDPAGPDEFVMDATTASDNDFEIGQTYTVLLPTVGPRQFTLVGVFNFGDPLENATGGAQLLAFDDETALDLLNGGRGYDDISISLANGADGAAVESAVAALLPDGYEIVTQEVVQEEQTSDFNEFIDIFQNVLLAFAIIIVLVSAFIIYNTFAILIGQQVREFGLLRALGASGRQITQSVIVESVAVGLFATVVGTAAGVGVAWVLQAIFDAAGADLPDLPLELRPRTIVAAAIVGVGITVASSVFPALRARRVSPMAALRDDVRPSSVPPPNAVLGGSMMAAGAVVLLAGLAGPWQGLLLAALVSTVLLYLGGARVQALVGRFAVVALGIVLLVVASVADFSTTKLLVALASGALVVFLGVNLISPLFAKPVANALGGRLTGIITYLAGAALSLFGVAIGVAAIAQTATGKVGFIFLLIPALILGSAGYLALRTGRAPWGTDGRIGRQNAGRSPRRTASTAAALMIGLALVGTVTVLGSSIKATFTSILDRSVAADWFLCVGDCTNPEAGFSPEMAARLSQLPEIDSVIPYRATEEGIRTPDDEVYTVLSADFPQLDEHMDVDITSGSFDDAGAGEIGIFTDRAEEYDLAVGDTLTLDFASGQSADFTVAAIYDDNRILGDWVISNEDWDTYFTDSLDQFVSLVTADGVSEEDARTAIEAITDDYSQVEVRTKDEFRDSQAAQIDQLLVVVNVFLGLAVIIALIGVANTLALSVFERTRELGLLRAVGMLPDQMRRMVRWEGVIVAAFGGLLGMLLGIVFGVVAVIVIPDSFIDTIDIPWLQMAIFVAFAGIAGLLAASFPARRAARLNVLDAIASE